MPTPFPTLAPTPEAPPDTAIPTAIRPIFVPEAVYAVPVGVALAVVGGGVSLLAVPVAGVVSAPVIIRTAIAVAPVVPVNPRKPARH